MKTYYTSDTPSDTVGNPVKAENIENLRKNLIQRYGKKVSLYISEAKGVQYYTVPVYRTRTLGYLYYHENQAWRYDSSPSGYYWTYGGRTRRVSPKTGRLLDVNKEWRYYT